MLMSENKISDVSSKLFSVSSLAIMACLLAMIGCDADENITRYTVAKEPPRAATTKGPAAGSPSAGGLTFTLPEGWRETRPRGGFALKSFVTSDGDSPAEVTVTPLEGNAGGQAANANRWRTQLGLPPLSQEDLDKQATSVEVAGGKGVLFDFRSVGDSPRRTIGVVHESDGKTWFFKLMGDDQAVGLARGSFVSFVKSVQFGSGGGKQP